jgi:hypothetical protein
MKRRPHRTSLGASVTLARPVPGTGGRPRPIGIALTVNPLGVVGPSKNWRSRRPCVFDWPGEMCRCRARLRVSHIAGGGCGVFARFTGLAFANRGPDAQCCPTGTVAREHLGPRTRLG